MLNQFVYNCLLGAVKSCREFDWIQAGLDDIDMEAQSRGVP